MERTDGWEQAFPECPNTAVSIPIKLNAIGVIHTPYASSAPYQPVDDDGDFSIRLFRPHEYKAGGIPVDRHAIGKK